VSWRERTLGELADLGIAFHVSGGGPAGVEVRGYRGDLVVVRTIFAGEVEAKGQAVAILEGIGGVAAELEGAVVVELSR